MIDLDYSGIFNVYVSMLTTAIPIAIFLFLLDFLLNFFFSFAFPKKYMRGE